MNNITKEDQRVIRVLIIPVWLFSLSGLNSDKSHGKQGISSARRVK